MIAALGYLIVTWCIGYAIANSESMDRAITELVPPWIDHAVFRRLAVALAVAVAPIAVPACFAHAGVCRLRRLLSGRTKESR